MSSLSLLIFLFFFPTTGSPSDKPKVDIYKIDGWEIRIAPKGSEEPRYRPIN